MLPSVSIFVVTGKSANVQWRTEQKGQEVRYLPQPGQDSKGLVWDQKRIDSKQGE